MVDQNYPKYESERQLRGEDFEMETMRRLFVYANISPIQDYLASVERGN